MKPSSSRFIYTKANLKELEEALSSERLANYINLATGNRATAIRLYLWNAELSESLQFPMHILEVVVRNAIHRRLSDGFGLDWYDQPSCPIKPSLRDAVQNAKVAIAVEGKATTPSRVIARLTLGFWVFLFSKRYDSTLWRPYLYGTFPNAAKPFNRRTVRCALNDIRLTRNRIAHHEPILTKSPDQIHERILEVVG